MVSEGLRRLGTPWNVLYTEVCVKGKTMLSDAHILTKLQSASQAVGCYNSGTVEPNAGGKFCQYDLENEHLVSHRLYIVLCCYFIC